MSAREVGSPTSFVDLPIVESIATIVNISVATNTQTSGEGREGEEREGRRYRCDRGRDSKLCED